MIHAHRPVLCEETVELLISEVSGAAIYVDATFGRGGHSRRLLERSGPDTRVIALDRDPEAVAAGRELAREDPRLEVWHSDFSRLAELLAGLGVSQVQGVMMDLGVSSPQLDDPARGFSFRFDAPLDMRMDPTRGETAADWLNRAEERDITWVLRTYGEERHARRIAAAIVAARPVTGTRQLAELVRAAQPRATPGKHGATRVFQALRIQVNRELTELETGLQAAFASLAPGGRLAVISFHSLEDRIVKRYFRTLTRPPALPRRLPVRSVDLHVEARAIAGPVEATDIEARDNPRARSARLRVIERLGPVPQAPDTGRPGAGT